MKTLFVLLVVTVLVAGALSKKGKRKEDGCRFKKESNKWSDCVDGKMSLTKNLKAGSGAHCEQTKVVTRDCVPGCKYKYKGKFTKCGKGVESRTREVTLKKQKKTAVGTCPQTITETQKCRVRCAYIKAKWGECDKATNTQTKIKILDEEKNEGKNCNPKKVKTRECKEKKKGKGKGRRNRRKKNRQNNQQ